MKAKFQGSRMKENRRLAGLGQLQLSDEIGVSIRTIQRWERGTLVPNAEQCLLLELALGGQKLVDIVEE